MVGKKVCCRDPVLLLLGLGGRKVREENEGSCRGRRPNQVACFVEGRRY